jgi:hypothetical protein
MTKLEEKFQQQMLSNAAAAGEFGANPARFLKQAQQHGALGAVRESIRRHRLSDVFEKLHAAGRLDLSPEAAVVSKQYAELFTDEEVDFCLEALLECGYFGYR